MKSSTENEQNDTSDAMNNQTPLTGSLIPKGQSSFMGMDTKILGLMFLVIILLFSNVLFAFEVIEDFGEDDDDDKNENGNGPETNEPKFVNLSVAESHELIQNNTANVHFVIIDVRTPTEFDEGHITDAMNIDFLNDSFQNRMGLLNIEITYLIYCRSGARSAQAMSIMADMGFMNVYNMLGGFTDWMDAGYEFNVIEPVIPTQIIENLTLNESYSLIQNNTNNTNFVILDVRTPGEYVDGHLNNSINFNSGNASFEPILDILDKNLTYFVHCQSGGRSAIARDKMEEKGFMVVCNMLVGFKDWKDAGYEYVV